MAASFQRPTPTPSVRPGGAQPSQVPATAPVLEFRCMFTHDLFKKQKKWHDGQVNYHTFNKRVMVYDESKNLVGGLHYRQPEEFGEGLEIKLDRPVLVQVEDQLGQTTTDLSPLIDRPGGNVGSSSNSQPVRNVANRLQGLNSQIKPKSIKELLAGSQNQLGRARLPIQSPFEQRHALNEVQANIRTPESPEPPTKKRKAVSMTAANRITPTRSPATLMPVTATVKAAARANASNELEVTREVMSISSDDEPVTSHKKGHVAKTRQRNPDNSKKQREKSTVKAKSTLVREKTHSIDRCLDERPKTAPHHQARPASTFPNGRSASVRLQDLGPRSSLKFTSQKTRPKLMYKALLRGTPGFSADATEIDASGQPSSDAPARQPQNHLLETDQFFALSQLLPRTSHSPGQRSARGHSLESSGSHQIDQDLDTIPTFAEQQTEDAPELISNSPLFVSQAEPLLSQSLNVVDDDPDSFLDNIDNVRGSSPMVEVEEDDDAFEAYNQSVAQEVEHSRILEPTPEPPSSPRMPSTNEIAEAPPIPPADAIVAKTIPMRTLSSPIEQRQTIPRTTRPFRRVVSESTALSPPDRIPSCQDNFLSDIEDVDEDDALSITPLKTNPAISVHNSTTMGPPPRLAKPLLPTDQSDNRQPIPARTRESSNESVQETDSTTADTEPRSSETGPWTSRESFLLFESWPKEKQKPDYGQDTNLASLSMTLNDIRGGVATSMSRHGLSKKYGTFGSAKFVSQQ